MNKFKWINFLREIKNLQMFSPCQDFDELILEEKEKSILEEKEKDKCTDILSQVHPLHSIESLNSLSLSPWFQDIVKQLQAPFPSSLISSYDIYMTFGFRFHPGQSEFLHQSIKLTKKHMERFTFLRNSLGFYSKSSYETLFSSGAGLRSLVPKRKKILVEAFSSFNGCYWRILVLVIFGIGCTVWYMCEPFSPHHSPELFVLIESYEPFLNNSNYNAPGFLRVSFLESHDVSASVESAMETEVPFSKISIPATGPVLKAVGLGVMVAFFFVVGVGLVPGLSEGVQ